MALPPHLSPERARATGERAVLWRDEEATARFPAAVIIPPQNITRQRPEVTRERLAGAVDGAAGESGARPLMRDDPQPHRRQSLARSPTVACPRTLTCPHQ
jgi:hypothetical protein